MKKFYSIVISLSLILLIRCGTPNEPDSIIGGDGGYKIVSKHLTSGYAQDIIVKDNFAYIAQGEGGFVVFDVSNRNAPVELAYEADSLKGYAYKLILNNSFVYIAAGAFGVSTINVSNPANPFVGFTNLQIKPARSFEIVSTPEYRFLLTASDEWGVTIAEASEPVYPQTRGYFYTHGFAKGLCVTPDSIYILVACGEMGLSVINVSQVLSGGGYGNHNTLIGWVDTPGYAEDVAVHPTSPYAFIASGTGGLQIADYSDSSEVKIVGSYSTGGYAKEVVYKDGKVYITTELRGLQIIDVSNVNSPVRIGTVPTKYAMGLFVDENYVYVADEVEGLIIISIP